MRRASIQILKDVLAMSTIILTPQSRLILQSPTYICRLCRPNPSRWYTTAGGLAALQHRKPKTPHDLPRTPARTRFAPSPTGYLHLGSLRTALYNWLLARATGGQFIIRVEDTDRTRIVNDAIPRLLDDLRWAELDWDEGPDKGGPYGPYEQSSRLDHYNKYVNQLLDTGKAYRCFCSPEDLDQHKLRAIEAGESGMYPKTCRSVSTEESADRAAAGQRHIVRFRSAGKVSFSDRVYGRNNSAGEDEDFILIKSDGYPTYHFANVVDDHLMEITHVIRGAEWLISTPKHVALYNAFGWTPPEFAHAGLLCDAQGRKLSKRFHDIDISSYRERGINPRALNNWVALLGWSKGQGSELIYSMEELAEKFSFKLSKGDIKTNPEKLVVFQRAHIQNDLVTRPPGFEQRVKAPVVEPVLREINRLQSLRQDGSLTTVTSPDTNDSFDISGMDNLVPELLSPVTQEAYILQLYTAIAKDGLVPSNPVSLLYNHPSLFWEPAETLYRQYGTAVVQDYKAQMKHSHDTAPDQLVEHLAQAFAAVPKEKWDPKLLQDVILECIGQTVREDKSAKQWVYTFLRLVLTGRPDQAAKPAKIQLAVLGREESLNRFTRFQKAIDDSV